jgi:hypothetical protein
MSRLSRYELLLGSLKGRTQGYGAFPLEQAYLELKELSGEDFGYNARAWERWLDENIADWRFETRPESLFNLIDDFRYALEDVVWAVKKSLKQRRSKRHRP